MPPTTPDDVPPESLAELMEFDPDPRTVWRPQELSAVFRALLETPVRLELGKVGAAAVEQDGGADALEQPLRPVTFADLLHGPAPSLAVLRLVKEFAKSARHDAESHLPTEVASALYCLSIVAGGLRCGRLITSMDDRDLRRNVEWALARPWIDDASRALLREAQVRLFGGPGGLPGHRS
ncbi:MAG TPA: hypothetical protein VFB66_08580 [Tepidisphaeraceae bacterium]|nr:hypothetical protein [Tepidisphaeraceae bacterium]